jgi:galactose mutarotase-like enzyme
MLVDLKYKETRGVADTLGGELISYMDGSKTEYLWNGEERFWSGRSPHLFPVIGTLKDGQTRIDGEYYSLLKHGFARNSEFDIYEDGEHFVTFLLRDNAETRKVYPFHFSFYVTHTLNQNGFTTSYKIVNEDEKMMYFNIGGHVGVKCPVLSGEAFEDYEIVFDRPLTAGAYFPPGDDPIIPEWYFSLLDGEDTLSLNHDLFESGPLIIDRIVSHSLKLKNKLNGRGIRFQYDGFPVLALWTFGVKKAPYLCLEPWHGMPAMEQDRIEFSEKPYMIPLSPHEEKNLQYTIKVLE